MILVIQPALAEGTTDAARFAERYRQMSIIHAQEATNRAADLAGCIEHLLATPTEQTLADCRAAWLRAHQAYLKARLFLQLAAREAGGPLGAVAQLDYTVDAWPIQEGYIDALEEYPTSGIVNDLTVPLVAESLRAQHGLTDREEVALGFHPLEFLLWDRKPGDFAPVTQLSAEQQEDQLALADLPQNRRRTLLLLLASLLSEEIGKAFATLSQPVAGKAATGSTALTATLSRGVTNAWRRLQDSLAQFLTGEPVQSHSRFSASTSRDIASEFEAIASLVVQPGRLIGELMPLDPGLGSKYLTDIEAARASIARLATLSPQSAETEKLDRMIVSLIAASERFDHHLAALPAP